MRAPTQAIPKSVWVKVGISRHDQKSSASMHGWLWSDENFELYELEHRDMAKYLPFPTSEYWIAAYVYLNVRRFFFFSSQYYTGSSPYWNYREISNIVIVSIEEVPGLRTEEGVLIAMGEF